MKTASGPLRIAIVAAEPSGDILAADLMLAIREAHPDAIFEGVAGPRMREMGCHALAGIEDLSIMLFSEIFWKLPAIYRLRRRLLQHFLQRKPDIFIGIDAAAFNLGIETRLKKAGIFTVHYNSPKIWAYHASRMKKIKRACDLMLCLFPFELPLYEKAGHAAAYIGHPMADSIPMQVDKKMARHALGLDENAMYLALMPGSRKQELDYLTPVFLETARRCLAQKPDLKLIAAAPNKARLAQYQNQLATLAPDLPVEIILEHSRDVMAASDILLLASGTITLEAMLLKKPMVVAYRLSAFSFWLLKRWVHCRFIALPNLLADEALVPELIQQEASADNLAKAVLELLQNDAAFQRQHEKFTDLHHILRKDSSRTAVAAIFSLR